MTRHIEAASSGPAARPIDMPAIVAEAHRRSAHHGLRTHDRPDVDPLQRAALSALVEHSRTLYAHALPVMETLHQQIAGTHNMVLLTDANGVILHSLGDADFLEKAGRVALAPGVDWSEGRRGTNAIGTALVEQTAATVHANQHYLAANHFLTCSAAPIVDHRGDVVGVLDVSGDKRSYHKHTMALVRMSALMIENQMFAAAFENAITVHFHTRPEFVGTLMEGIASFSPGGRFLAANRNGVFQLGLSLPSLRAHTFSSLFGLPLSALYDHYRAAAPGLLDLCMHNGVRVRGRAELRLTHGTPLLTAEAVHPAARPTTHRVPQPPSATTGLRALDSGDARVAHVLAKLERVAGRGVSILIMGETGTGKDVLARAIHADSPRAHGPLVAINCASIPEALIESELFGYEEGAFTGARRKGAVGRIVQAHGGTLFLDEIGDMPLPLQARLLRVLEERQVTPLGGGKSTAVDVELVCATHRSLRQRIADGLFREDLYYRLNGLVVTLPPLRERSDLDALVTRMLATLPGRPHRIADEVAQLFRRHRWPGNLRQLASLLRTAALMARDAQVIHVADLPDDFLDEGDLPPVQTPACAPSARAHAGDKLDDLALDAIQRTLEAHGGNVSAAARALGISRNTIYRKLQRASR